MLNKETLNRLGAAVSGVIDLYVYITEDYECYSDPTVCLLVLITVHNCKSYIWLLRLSTLLIEKLGRLISGTVCIQLLHL